ncbi:winged helix-turn-helix domain-containing protein [Methylocaldum sp.]|uniref:winged helix-turn-helix domain-containing protein n=1 Tax=Methylocaldum sp. TaxID=1969727 RepID=UPI002D46D55A|nr:hypothetical protein [Methylocaldum sp.]HYE34623.1 hypothetical protein [Methylocaldum sp.]
MGRVQDIALRETICDEMRDASGLAFALWTRQAVQALIAQETKVLLPIRTVELYLQQWREMVKCWRAGKKSSLDQLRV